MVCTRLKMHLTWIILSVAHFFFLFFLSISLLNTETKTWDLLSIFVHLKWNHVPTQTKQKIWIFRMYRYWNRPVIYRIYDARQLQMSLSFNTNQIQFVFLQKNICLRLWPYTYIYACDILLSKWQMRLKYYIQNQSLTTNKLYIINLNIFFISFLFLLQRHVCLALFLFTVRISPDTVFHLIRFWLLSFSFHFYLSSIIDGH